MANDNTPQGGSPFNIWWVVSAMLFVLVLVLAGILVFNGLRDDDADKPPAAARNHDSTKSSSNGQDGASGEQCPEMPKGNPDVPAAAPPVSWEKYYKGKLPTSKRYGPSRQGQKTWSCFGHNPTGAALAATYLLWGLAGPHYEEVAQTAGLKSTARERWIQKQTPKEHKLGSGNPIPEMKGFRIDSYTGSTAKVEILEAAGSAQIAGKAFLKWSPTKHDWLIRFDKGDPISDVNGAPNPGDFTSWDS